MKDGVGQEDETETVERVTEVFGGKPVIYLWATELPKSAKIEIEVLPLKHEFLKPLGGVHFIQGIINSLILREGKDQWQ